MPQSSRGRSSHLHPSLWYFFLFDCLSVCLLVFPDYKACRMLGGGIGIKSVGRCTYLNTVIEVVKDIGSKQEIFSMNDGVWQGEVHKERLEGCQGSRHRYTKSSQFFHTEGTGLPFSDSVGDGVWDTSFSSRAGGNVQRMGLDRWIFI